MHACKQACVHVCENVLHEHACEGERYLLLFVPPPGGSCPPPPGGPKVEATLERGFRLGIGAEVGCLINPEVNNFVKFVTQSHVTQSHLFFFVQAIYVCYFLPCFLIFFKPHCIAGAM
jgi:hypothetical protein